MGKTATGEEEIAHKIEEVLGNEAKQKLLGGILGQNTMTEIIRPGDSASVKGCKNIIVQICLPGRWRTVAAIIIIRSPCEVCIILRISRKLQELESFLDETLSNIHIEGSCNNLKVTFGECLQ